MNNVVQDYIDKGIVEVFNYTCVHPIQPICYDEIFNRYRDLYDWWILIDIDEFIYLPTYDLKSYVKTIPYNINLIYMIWRNYDDNNLIHYDDRPVIERFTHLVDESKITNYIGKSLFRNDKTWNGKIISHHDINNKYFKKYDCHFNKLYGKTTIRDFDYNAIYDCIYIKHFMTKSLEEWIWRNKRGDTLKDKYHLKYPYKLDNF